jgi:hypothetical protein
MMLKSVLVLVLATTLTGCAYDTYGNNNRRYGNGNNNSRTERSAFNAGYQDGARQGRDDARDGDRFDPRGQREYRTADNGRWGSRYDDEYRNGFVNGYEEGYRNARNNGRARGRRR